MNLNLLKLSSKKSHHQNLCKAIAHLKKTKNRIREGKDPKQSNEKNLSYKLIKNRTKIM